MRDERKVFKDEITEYPSDYGLGTVTGKFEAEKYPNTPLLDTSVELYVNGFSITWDDRKKLMKELAAVIAKYQI